MLHELRFADAATGGAKAAALGTMLRAGLPVPDGFVLTFDEYGTAHTGPYPNALRDEVERAYARLGCPVVAVRSSASGEDSEHASAAGTYESVLGVRGVDALAAAIHRCWDSLHSPRAVAYQQAADREPSAERPAMAVIVQRMVDADASGVLFTPAKLGGMTLIESSWGLGPSVAEGRVTPDRFHVGGDGAIQMHLGDKRTRLDMSDQQLVSRDVDDPHRGAPTLDDEQMWKLVRLGAEIAELLGGPQDIEWAIAGARSWIVQARPVTVAPPASFNPTDAPTPVLTGAAASTGSATGTARIVRGPQDFSRVTRGDILVCPSTDPSWTPLLGIAGGVVTERGGSLAHAAIVARELGIPAVLGVTNATSLLTDGSIITIDGDLGTVVEHQPT
ncbi:PEP/pyruvate-binding domain-containing protein [Paramicrobacterium fandaimingii]|uniref:PEP/pyruvate-binding domain-containing protein n=1 Tax=Paramicrobacterium fandaimingii TaxID=2708079 RepID=UPI00142276BB|nr:PEP/pyruvate-binding domain-containing protein [Microbacterium fandaimingii]